ncbi:MAG TPA: glutathione S-transferase family protein [Thermoanaerobaculia bacterium]|nr:glutathione S-transferase family protein [Thermoanaerobaculia bacterium]
MRLFGDRLSPYVDKVASALELKRVPFESVPIRSLGDLKRWNPITGKMPVLELGDEHGGERLWDSTRILRRLEELHPEPRLLSADPAVAAAQRQLEDWSDESLYWYVMSYRWAPSRAARSLGEIFDHAKVPPMVRVLAGGLWRRRVRQATLAQGLGRLPEEVLERELEGRLDDLATLLGADPWFVGEGPSWADLAVVGELRFLGISEDGRRKVEARPALAALERRLGEACAAAHR